MKKFIARNFPCVIAGLLTLVLTAAFMAIASLITACSDGAIGIICFSAAFACTIPAYTWMERISKKYYS